jgi:isopentenyldiphosphate isomerase
VVLSSGEVLLQRRGLQKDTHPGKVDVSVAGHLAAGEADAAASVAREAEEEIGLVVTAVELTHLFVRRHEDVREGHVDRELQDVFVTKTPTRLDDLRPAHDELLGVLAVAFRDARALVDGTATEVGARERRVGGGVARLILRREELVAHDDGYFSRALSAIAGRT